MLNTFVFLIRNGLLVENEQLEFGNAKATLLASGAILYKVRIETKFASRREESEAKPKYEKKRATEVEGRKEEKSRN